MVRLSISLFLRLVLQSELNLLSTFHRWDTQGSTQSFQSHSTGGGGAGGSTSFRSDQFKTLSEVVTENLGMSEKPDFFSSRATITYIKSDNMSYPACPADKCNKKVSMEAENSWRCEKCEQTYEAPQYRYVLLFSRTLVHLEDRLTPLLNL